MTILLVGLLPLDSNSLGGGDGDAGGGNEDGLLEALSLSAIEQGSQHKRGNRKILTVLLLSLPDEIELLIGRHRDASQHNFIESLGRTLPLHN